MKAALALVLMTAPAFADEPAPVPPEAPAPSAPTVPPASPAQPAPAPTADPPVDPAYGERPAPHESSQRVGPDETGFTRHGKEIVVRYHPDRSRENVTMIAILAGAGAVFGAVGLYYHFDSRSANADVAADRFTGDTWSAAHQETYDRAYNSSLIAGISYGIGAALLLTTAVAYIATEPALETRVIRPHTNPRRTSFAPLPGGGFVSRGWSF